MNATTYLLVKAPRGAQTHLSRHGEQTLCGRDVRATWSLEAAPDASAATCTGCQVWAGPTLTEQRTAATVELETVPATPQLPRTEDAGTLLVVPCSGAKLEHGAPAAKLYRGTLTTMGLAACASIAQSHVGTRTMILSALHGLVDLDRVLEPYDVKMGDPGSITTEQLAEQLRATGARRVVALTPNGYTAALVAACLAAGLELPEAPLAGSRGIGEQRGRLAQLRRSAGYGMDWGLTTRASLRELEYQRMAEEMAQRITAGQPAMPGRDVEAEPLCGWEQRVLRMARERAAQLAEEAPQLVHLLSDGLLDECGTSVAGPDGFHQFTPVWERVSCPRCRQLMPAVLEAAQTEALAEEKVRAAVQLLDEAPPEQFGTAPPAASSTSSLLERGRRAIVRAEQLRRSAALHVLPPGGTLHA